ncbi:MAG: DUF3794 and LysM peptidoglycan-binding domain-containing protein [Clostridia bacterium]
MLDLIKDYMRLSCISRTESQSAVYEFDCIIPDILPDMAKILAIDAAAGTETISKGSSSATVNFRIDYKILYMPDVGKMSEELPETPEIKSFSAFSEHTAVLDTDIIGENTIVRAACCVENIESDYINSRKISIKTAVRIEPSIINTNEEGICTGIAGLEDVQTQKNSITLSTIAESSADTIAIDEDIELSSGKAAYKELLRTDAILADATYSVAGDKLQIRGNLEICTLYISDDRTQSVQIIENEVPFAHSIEVETIGDDILWKADFLLKSYKAEICQDSDGENRILHVEAEICVTADAYTAQTFELLNDAYSLTQKFTLEKTEITGMLVTDDISGQFVLRDSASKSEEQPEISQVVNVTAMVGQVKAEVEDGRVNAEGEIICNVLYMSNDSEQPASSFLTRLPFSQSFDSRQAKAGMSACMSFDINHVSFNIMSPSEIELRISVSAKGTVIKYCTFTVINNVTQPDDPFICDEEEKPSILLYVVQPGDTLWKIAKRYNAPVELLKEVNQLKNPDLILPGQKLLIPR